ncbi:MAG: hypothetical protein H0U49_04760 [Parachlamydiaceae bacterium]|nr:hypothetical protein [Parachlamydiaceae bacterium]
MNTFFPPMNTFLQCVNAANIAFSSSGRTFSSSISELGNIVKYESMNVGKEDSIFSNAICTH